MATLTRRAKRSANIWPGFVDALVSLLMVIMFLLMVFVLAQFFLGEAISGRDQALEKLQSQIGELGELLALERGANKDLRVNVAQLSQQLQASVTDRDDLNATIESLTASVVSSQEKADKLSKGLADALKTISVDKETIEIQLGKLAALTQDVAALQALKEELEKNLAKVEEEAETKDKALIQELKISESARAQVALLNKQMAAIREQISQLSTALEISERQSQEQKAQIVNLGKRLNAALASKVQELSRYRSEFFGRLREVLGKQAGVRIVGDRFVFQSEVLFPSGSAELEPAGQAQLSQLAKSLAELSTKIPGDIDWVMRIDGHTDKVPIATRQFPSNWELSSARAISVVKYLISNGIPANRLVAAGFGEFQPLDARGDEIANRRNRRIELKLTQR
ncbi:MAG: peptidoglycan -binding protein [Rhodospirillales bacterium]|nr:peptidoglycan -binding protein [Rhodospirillales bacterium]